MTSRNVTWRGGGSEDFFYRVCVGGGVLDLYNVVMMCILIISLSEIFSSFFLLFDISDQNS